MKEEKDRINPKIKIESELSSDRISPDTNKTYFDSPPLNIGNNIIINKKYILGIKENLKYFFVLLTSNIIIFLLYLIFIYSYFLDYSNIIIKIFLLIIPIFFFFSIFYQIKCFITEPGIIPRASPIYQKNFSGDKFIFSKKEHRPIIMVQKHCYICNINRPNKSFHCFLCNNCVEEFENHCLYVANCIGKRNKKFYLFFLFFNFLFYTFCIFVSFIQFFLSCIEFNAFYKIFFKEFYVLIILIGVLILGGIIIFFIFHKNRLFFMILLFCNLIYCYIFYVTKNKYAKFSPIYLSPFNIFLICFCFLFDFINFMFLYEQIHFIFLGITSLDYRNFIFYNKALRESNYNDDDDVSYSKSNVPNIVIKEIPTITELPKFNFKNAINNFKLFIKRRIPPSLILQDLNYY